MAYNNNRSYGGYSGSSPRQYSDPGRSAPRQDHSRPAPPPEIRPEPLPKDYVDQAEKIIGEISQQREKITTSKIRNLLSLVSDIYNVEKLRTTEEELLPDSAAKLGMIRVRTAYEAGRDSAVRNFVEQAKLLQYIKGIGLDRKAFLDFAHYMEALVAYHRYYGGKD